MIRFPTRLDEAVPESGASLRAGGTDLQERLARGQVQPRLVDLRDVPGLSDVEPRGAGWSIGARVTVARIAEHPTLLAHYPGLTAAASSLATPQIRAVGTLGGNLAQRVRCWYFRNPDVRCLKEGGDFCLAREGDHVHHACFDRGPCVAPHPSTLALALLAYDAEIEIHGAPNRSIEAFLGDGDDPTRENTLEAEAIIVGATLPEPWPDERAAYFRTISRARAEWPLVEVVARLKMQGGSIGAAAVAIGGVANVPFRLHGVEQALVGQSPSDSNLHRAAERAQEGASPLPMTRYKVDLLVPTVLETLERAMQQRTTPS